MTTDAKVQIGLSSEFLEGTAVDTPAGIGLFREGVVLSDPQDADGRANVRALSTQLLEADKGIVTNTVIHGRTTAGHGAFVDVKVNPSGALSVDSSGSVVSLDSSTLNALESITVQNTVAVQATDLDIRNLSNTQDSVRNFDSTDSEYLRVATSITSAGDTTLVTPSANRRIRLQWVYAINDPTANNSTKITIKLGSDVQYVAWAISKRQQLTGAPNAPLIVNLSQPGDVAVTIFYQEVD